MHFQQKKSEKLKSQVKFKFKEVNMIYEIDKNYEKRNIFGWKERYIFDNLLIERGNINIFSRL